MACRILVPQPGMEPLPSAFKHNVLTTGPSGKSQRYHLRAGIYIYLQNDLEAYLEFLNLSEFPVISWWFRRPQVHVHAFLFLSQLLHQKALDTWCADPPDHTGPNCILLNCLIPILIQGAYSCCAAHPQDNRSVAGSLHGILWSCIFHMWSKRGYMDSE